MQILIDTFWGMWYTHPVWTAIFWGIPGLIFCIIIWPTKQPQKQYKKEFQKQLKSVIRWEKHFFSSKEYYPHSNAVRRQYFMAGGVKHGPEEIYYHSGKINKQQNWDHGKLDGECTVYYPTGEIYMRSSYKRGELEKKSPVYYKETAVSQVQQVEPNPNISVLEKKYKLNFSEYKSNSQKTKTSGFWNKAKKVPKIIFGIQAWQDRKQAKNIEKSCYELYQNARKITFTRRDMLKKGISRLGTQRLQIFRDIIGKFLGYLQDLDQQNREKIYELLSEADINREIFRQMGQMNQMVKGMQDIDMSRGQITGKTLLIGTAGYITASATPAAVTSAVGAVASASTGTAISSLSGVAATNATLAWLGGGSIASGGGGMAGGAIMLGGIKVIVTGGVVLALTGLFASAHYSNKLTKTTKSAAKMVTKIKEIEKSWTILDSIIKRINELIDITNQMEKRAWNCFNRLIPLVPDFAVDDTTHVQTFQQTALLIKSLMDLINTPLLDEKGNISEQGMNIITSSKKLLKNTELITHE